MPLCDSRMLSAISNCKIRGHLRIMHDDKWPSIPVLTDSAAKAAKIIISI